MKEDKAKFGYIEGWLSIIANLLLFGLKYWAGIVTRSVAIIADAWHTLSDSITSVIVLAGTHIANKPADEEHPFGYGRMELIASVIIGVILGVVGFNFLVESIHKLRSHEPAEFGTLAIVATVISIVIKEAMAQYAIRTGKRIQAHTLIADGFHHRTDAISSAIILVGIFLGTRFWWIDGVLGILVALVIFYSTFEVLRDSISPLLGEKADDKLTATLKEIANRVIGKDIHLHHIHLHCYGHHTEISFHIRLSPDLPLIEAHRQADLIERDVERLLDMEATIHVEPEMRE